jgi:hypothetical protein
LANEQNNEQHPFHVEGSGIVFDKPKSQEEIARQRREDEQHEFARQQVQTNKRMAWFTGLLVVGTFAGTAIGIWQASISQTAANAARDAANTASGTLAEIQASNRAQTVANDKALQATIDNFHLDQRAWLAPLVPISKVENGKAFFKVPFKNTGRTPAIDAQAGLKITNNPSLIPTTDPEPDKGSGKGLIPPDGVETTSNIDYPLDEAHTKLVLQGTHVYVFGTMRYKDIFGQKHWTQYCYETWGTMEAARPCAVHNKTDDTQKTK